MKNCVESNIKFDFSLARTVCEHDTTTPKCDEGTTPDRNTYWPGVDFRIEDEDGWIWLEVKDWRGRMPGSFVHKMRSKAFAEQMRGKFLGTTAFLVWNQIFQSDPVR